MEELKDKTAALSNFLSKLLRDNFGKGPEGVYVSIANKYITFHVRKFMSPTEKILLRKRQDSLLQETRDLVMQDLIPEIKANILHMCKMEVQEFYYDWDLHNKSAIFVAVTSEETKSDYPVTQHYPGKMNLEKEVVHISRTVQKTPDYIESFFLNSRTLLVIRQGILVSIEKELIRDGLQEKLKLTKRKMEKTHFHSNSHFEENLGTSVHDIFVDWDFDRDKSLIVFITNPLSVNE
ncbi:Na-translocating system protein MpsC family protein [Radiobacillus sp. PE A8.2]|uniref:Na-translocating system protein MpsC family protein n=1 Tax=Radiobacillus sp. PE A8.2 TaxID=3380349 RepID=UPI00389081CD